MGTVIEKDRLFALPLYHGTSTYFWPSINQHGLGGFNIVANWRLLPMLSKTIDLIKATKDQKAEHWLRLRWPHLKLIFAQGAYDRGENWRHGDVYVTPSENRAVRYAIRGFGSELLGVVAQATGFLAAIDPDEATALLADYPEAAAALSAKHRPIVLALRGVSIDRLRSEKGCDPGPTISLAENLLASSHNSPQVTFELTGVVKPHELSARAVTVTEWAAGDPKAWTNTPVTNGH